MRPSSRRVAVTAARSLARATWVAGGAAAMVAVVSSVPVQATSASRSLAARLRQKRDVLARRGVGALDRAQVEHRRAAAGERVGRGGVGRGSNVEVAVEPDDLPRGGGERQTEDEEENRPDDACRHPSVNARTIARSSKKWRFPERLRELRTRLSDQKLNWRRDHQRTTWRGWSSPIGMTTLLWTRSSGVTK